MKNKYGFLNNKFVLVEYIVYFNEVFDDVIISQQEDALSIQHLDKIKSRLDNQNIQYTVESVDNSDIEWIVDSNIDQNLIDNAIQLGQDDFYDFMYLNDDDAQRDIILLQILDNLNIDNSSDLINQTYSRLSKNKSLSKKQLQQFSNFNGVS